MKIKRYKKAERYMSLYKNNFGFREPYQVLLDGTFCQVALAHKVNIQDQLPKYLGGECKLLTTACVIEETKRLGKPLHGAHLIVSQFPVHNCGHEEAVSASKCLSSFVMSYKNRDHYLVATQDHNLRLKISKSVVCPLVKLANNALVLEKPTEKVRSRVDRKHDHLANEMSLVDKEKLDRLKEEENLSSNDKELPAKRKRKGPKGPNPLSCKKGKKTSALSDQKNSTKAGEEVGTRRRHRKKVHIAPHVKKFLKESISSG